MKVFIIAAITADGFIGRGSYHQADWTGQADKRVFVSLTKGAGVMVMGAKTFGTIGRALPGRRNIVLTHDPNEHNVENVEFTSEPPKELLARLQSEGAKAVAICGGASIYTLFAGQNLVDELYLTVVPKLFGQGLALFSKELDINLEHLETTQLDDGAILLHYKFCR